MNTQEYLEGLGATIDAKDSVGFANYITENGSFRFGNWPAVVGRENITNAVSEFFKSITSSKHKVLKYWKDDNSIVWQGEVLYTRLDGNQVSVNFVNIFNMDGEMIKDYLIYIDNSPLYADMATA
ncbi:MAG TPA: nuclear transport factor 2 family protein [Ignavibacteria bacterium]|nr:nuclear transport factor 2 family protein [Ignavibacteria bacterium]